MTKRFEELITEILALHKAKNHDYSNDDEALSNFYECEDFGVSAWKGALTRMCDKWSRIKSLVKKGNNPSVKDEKLVDTLKDLAVYSLLTIELIERDSVKNLTLNSPIIQSDIDLALGDQK